MTLTGLPRAGSPVLPRRILLGEVGLWVPKMLSWLIRRHSGVAEVLPGHVAAVRLYENGRRRSGAAVCGDDRWGTPVGWERVSY